MIMAASALVKQVSVQRIAAQPLPSYDSVRSAPGTTCRRAHQPLCAGPLPIEICRY